VPIRLLTDLQAGIPGHPRTPDKHRLAEPLTAGFRRHIELLLPTVTHLLHTDLEGNGLAGKWPQQSGRKGLDATTISSQINSLVLHRPFSANLYPRSWHRPWF